MPLLTLLLWPALAEMLKTLEILEICDNPCSTCKMIARGKTEEIHVKHYVVARTVLNTSHEWTLPLHFFLTPYFVFFKKTCHFSTLTHIGPAGKWFA